MQKTTQTAASNTTQKAIEQLITGLETMLGRPALRNTLESGRLALFFPLWERDDARCLVLNIQEVLVGHGVQAQMILVPGKDWLALAGFKFCKAAGTKPGLVNAD